MVRHTTLCYNENDFIVPSFNKNIMGSLDEYFVTLEIVERDRNVYETSWSFDAFSKRDIIPGRRQKSGAQLQVEDIMNFSLNKIAVYGSPGTGKTTFCKKIVYEFYKNQKMKNIFEDIIWIQLRRLREKSLKGEDFQTIDELVADYFRISENVLKFEKCLFILDGWDELHDLGGESIVINLVKDIISKYKVIVTSRPYVDLTHIFRHADQILEIQGFDEFNVRKYIKNVLKSGSKLSSKDETKILDFLSSSIISDMMSIPILLDIFLFTWEEIEITQISKLTITKLYELIVLKLWNEFIQWKIPDRADDSQNLKSVIKGPLSEENRALSILAQTCFERGDLLFSYLEIKGNDHCKEQVVKTRFVNGVEHDERNPEWKRYEFIHLTFCEFFTALNFVFYKSIDELADIIAKYKYNISYKVIFGFMCGLISNGTHGFDSQEEMLDIFFDCLESEPIDVVRGYHNMLIATCLNECSHNLKEKRAIEIVKDLNDTYCQPIPPFTSLAIISTAVKNKINLIKFVKCRLPNLTDKFFEQSGFSDMDEWSKINILGSQISFNVKSKNKLKELLVDGNNKHIFNFFSNNCRGIPDFFIKYILENFANTPILIQKLQYIKMPLQDSKNVCQYLVETIVESDSIPQIITKIINSEQNIFYMAFLRNVYEFTVSFGEMLPALFDEDFSEIAKSRIIFLIVIFNITSKSLLNKLMEIMQEISNANLRSLIVRAIFHLYYDKRLPISVAIYLTKYLLMSSETGCELTEDENPYVDIWRTYLNFFRSDIFMATTMYELVCEGLAHSNFKPTLMDNIISRLCTGEQPLDYIMSYLLCRKPLTDGQIENFIESDKIEFKDKFSLLSERTQNRKVTAFFVRNATNLFAIDNISKFYSKKERDFTESEKKELVKHSAVYELYYTECHSQFQSLSLKQIEKKIIEMNEQKRYVFEACEKYCSNLSFDTFQASVIGIISNEQLSETYELAFTKPYLSLNQKGTFLADAILILSKNQHALDIDNFIKQFWTYEESGSVLDKCFFERLADDIFGHYHFQILERALNTGALHRGTLIQWVSPVNIKHLLTFLIYEITPIKNALYIQPSSSSSYRLCSSNVQSEELGIADINFVYDFGLIKKYFDHPCMQVRKNAISDVFTMDKCKNYYLNVEGVSQLKGISDKQKETNTQLIKFFEGPHERNFIKFVEMLYDQNILIGNSQQFDMRWASFYAHCFRITVNRFVNFGPFHIDLSSRKFTDIDIVLPDNPNVVKFLGDIDKNVHVLVLSNNHITINGFERLLKSAINNKVKHLFLDGNHIYFDIEQFNKFKILITDPNLELLTLDLSSNFIAAEFVNEIKSLNSENFTNERRSLKYSLINNCRLIYERSLTNSHKGFEPAIELIAKVERKEVPLRITQNNGCVGHVSKKQKFGYSGHVLIFIEQMVNGQREFKTAELFQHSTIPNSCKVVIRNKDPFVDHVMGEISKESFKNRLLAYNVPTRGLFSNEQINQLVQRIEDSQNQDNFYEYNISTENEFENRYNCIKWANGMLKLLLLPVIEEKIPWLFRSSRNLVLEILGLITFLIYLLMLLLILLLIIFIIFVHKL